VGAVVYDTRRECHKQPELIEGLVPGKEKEENEYGWDADAARDLHSPGLTPAWRPVNLTPAASEVAQSL